MKILTALAAALAVSMTISVAHSEEIKAYEAAYQGRTLIDILRGSDTATETAESPVEKKAETPVEKKKAKLKLKVKERTVVSKSVAGPYGAIIAKHAAANGIPAHLARAVVKVESNFRVNARGSAGEIGLMQIKPTTARMLGYTGSVKGLYDPETNISFGMKYLGMAHKLGGGDTCGTILRYNAGHAAKRMNPVSSAYCGKVKRLIAVAG